MSCSRASPARRRCSSWVTSGSRSTAPAGRLDVRRRWSPAVMVGGFVLLAVPGLAAVGLRRLRGRPDRRRAADAGRATRLCEAAVAGGRAVIGLAGRAVVPGAGAPPRWRCAERVGRRARAGAGELAVVFLATTAGSRGLLERALLAELARLRALAAGPVAAPQPEAGERAQRPCRADPRASDGAGRSAAARHSSLPCGHAWPWSGRRCRRWAEAAAWPWAVPAVPEPRPPGAASGLPCEPPPFPAARRCPGWACRRTGRRTGRRLRSGRAPWPGRRAPAWLRGRLRSCVGTASVRFLAPGSGTRRIDCARDRLSSGCSPVSRWCTTFS